MDQEGHADPLHDLQRALDVANVRDARRGVGGGVSRIELAGGEDALGKAALHLARVHPVRQVAGHQGREVETGLHRRQDALAVGSCGRDRGHRRLEVRHDDGPGELTGRVVDHRGQHGVVAQVYMPVVRLAKGQAFDGGPRAASKRRALRRRHGRESPETIAAPMMAQGRAETQWN